MSPLHYFYIANVVFNSSKTGCTLVSTGDNIQRDTQRVCIIYHSPVLFIERLTNPISHVYTQ